MSTNYYNTENKSTIKRFVKNKKVKPVEACNFFCQANKIETFRSRQAALNWRDQESDRDQNFSSRCDKTIRSYYRLKCIVTIDPFIC